MKAFLLSVVAGRAKISRLNQAKHGELFDRKRQSSETVKF